MIVIHDERCHEYSQQGHPERPARVRSTQQLLQKQCELEVTWQSPLAVDRSSLERAHHTEHLDRVEAGSRDFDGDTPAYPDIYHHALRSTGAGLRALNAATDGKTAFSLMRPPGHHATRDRAMGFCYFNSIAISVMEARSRGVEKVAVLDFDVHHGNGTEAILLNRKGTAYYSVHQHPCYPGTGTRNVGDNCFNFPVAPQTPREDYRRVLSRALDTLLGFRPELIAVSAGFDAYARDPLAQETLEAEDFHWVGQSLRELGIPFYSILEGGYSSQLPHLIMEYLKGVMGKKAG